MAHSTEPRWITRIDGGWCCGLCPHHCLWTPENPTGKCRIRGLRDGVPALPGWGGCVSLAIDPVEKKPLYHFHPGASVLSTGPAGCNLSCSFCQNWEISQRESSTRLVQPEDLVGMALSRGSGGMAFTYTEPTIWFEYVMATAPLVREAGGFTVMVSNGYVESGPLDEYLKVINAWNIDLKGWSDRFYPEFCGASIKPVLASIEKVAASGSHLEVTFLVIPGLNDDPREWEAMGSWLASHAGRRTPLHVSRYFPRYRLETPPTPLETISRAVESFRAHLDFVYPGNVAGEENTLCPSCGALLIRRSGYSVEKAGISGGRCIGCGADAGVVQA